MDLFICVRTGCNRDFIAFMSKKHEAWQKSNPDKSSACRLFRMELTKEAGEDPILKSSEVPSYIFRAWIAKREREGLQLEITIHDGLEPDASQEWSPKDWRRGPAMATLAQDWDTGWELSIYSTSLEPALELLVMARTELGVAEEQSA